MDDLKDFRQWGCKTPGHPEYQPHRRRGDHHRPAGAGHRQRRGHGHRRNACWPRKFNQPEGFHVVDHHTYAFCGDGCMMEGIANEACLPGRHHEAGQADRSCTMTMRSPSRATPTSPSARTCARASRAYGWNVIDVRRTATAVAGSLMPPSAWPRIRDNRPSLIVCHTTIGYGCPQGRARPAATARPWAMITCWPRRRPSGMARGRPSAVAADVYELTWPSAPSRGEAAQKPNGTT